MSIYSLLTMFILQIKKGDLPCIRTEEIMSLLNKAKDIFAPLDMVLFALSKAIFSFRNASQPEQEFLFGRPISFMAYSVFSFEIFSSCIFVRSGIIFIWFLISDFVVRNNCRIASVFPLVTKMIMWEKSFWDYT